VGHPQPREDGRVSTLGEEPYSPVGTPYNDRHAFAFAAELDHVQDLVDPFSMPAFSRYPEGDCLRGPVYYQETELLCCPYQGKLVGRSGLEGNLSVLDLREARVAECHC